MTIVNTVFNIGAVVVAFCLVFAGLLYMKRAKSRAQTASANSFQSLYWLVLQGYILCDTDIVISLPHR